MAAAAQKTHGAGLDAFRQGLHEGCAMSVHARCDKSVGFGYLDQSVYNRQSLCGHDGGEIFMTSVPAVGGCGPDDVGHVVTLRDSTVRWNDNQVQGWGFDLRARCINPQLDLIPSRKDNMANVGRGLNFLPQNEEPRCDRWIEEPTILLVDPRGEVLFNMYHAIEELVGVYQSAAIVGGDAFAGDPGYIPVRPEVRRPLDHLQAARPPPDARAWRPDQGP